MITVGTDFSGLGAPEMALKELGIEHKILFACEKDKYAKASYLANHEAEIFYEDVTTRDNEKAPEVDLYCFGFPCQSFSLSGKRKGFDDVRGTLFFNSAEYVRLKRPKVFIAENVKGLLSHDKPKGSKSKHGRTFSTIINLLAKTINGQILMPMYEDNLGYNVFYTVLNSKYYDVPQNRERVFIVGFRDDVEFAFPQSKKVTKRLKDILEPVVDEKYYLSDKMLSCLLRRNDKNYENHNGFKTNFLNEENIANTLRSNYHKMTGDMDYIEEPVCAAMRGRNPDNPSDRTTGAPTEQRLEINKDGVTNTLTSVQKDNLIIVKEATKKGYAIAEAGDSINLSNPESKTRRGRVGVGVANTLDTACNQAVVVDEVIQLNPSLESNGQQPFQQNRVYDLNALSPAVVAQMSCGSHAITFQTRIRRLTPLECFRLQGFSDDFFFKCKAVNSDTRLYQQAGNSITVNVLKAIIKNIKFTQ